MPSISCLGAKSMNPHEIKKQTQTILGDGLVGVVRCGRSSAEGLPGMYDLARVFDQFSAVSCTN